MHPFSILLGDLLSLIPPEMIAVYAEVMNVSVYRVAPPTYQYHITLRLRVTNSTNSLINNFGVDAYTTINSAGALVRKDS